MINSYEFEVLEYKYPDIRFRIVCSTGTYIRTLVRDLARELDTYATATDLRRIRIGTFTVEDASDSIISVDKILKILDE